MRLGRFLLLAASISLFVSVLSAQEVHDGNQTGFPPFGSFHGSDFDLVSLQNGNLHLQIPVARIPQRAGKVFSYAFLYDTPSWEINNTVTDPRSPASWLVSPAAGEVARWRLVTPGQFSVNYEISQKQCSYNSGLNQITYFLYTSWTVTDENGTKHPFALRYESNPLAVGCTAGDLGYGNQLKGTALDGSGIVLDATSNPPYGWVVTLKDGSHGEAVDTNGNFINGNADWLGRQNLTRAVFSSYETWTVNDSNGAAQQFRLDYAQIPIQTSLCGTLSNCTEYNGTWNLPVKLTLPTGKFYQFTWVQNGNGDLQRVDLPTGGYISYAYTTNWYGVLIHGGGKENARRAVSSRTVSDGQTANTWTYPTSCGNGVHDPLGNDEVHTYSFLGQATTTMATYETQVQTYQGSCSTGTLLRTITKDYLAEQGPYEPAGSDGNGFDYGLINARVIRETTALNDGQVSKAETDFETFQDTFLNSPFTNTRLNVTERREFAYGAGAPGSLARRTDNTYLHTNNTTYQNLNILDRVASTIVYDGASNIAAQTQFEYDNYTQPILGTNAINHNSAYGPTYLTRGNVTAVKRWRNTDATWLTTRNQYDDVGNVISTADPLSHTTQFDFSDAWGNATCAPATGSARGYLKSRTNALGQITSYTHNSCTGTVASTTDPNSLVTTFSYDLMNRLTVTNLPDSGQMTNCYTDMGGATCSQAPAPFSTFTTKKINATTNLTTVALTDGVARVKQSQLTSDPQGVVYTDTTYDALGRVASVSNPYRQGTDITSSPGITSYAYDGLGRKTKETYPDGSFTQTAYCGASTLVTDPVGKWRRSRTDALGRLVEVDEPNAPGASVNSNGCVGSGEPVWVTTYGYDTLGNLTSVLQNGSHPRSFTYDSLSHLLTAANPETGTITYAYNNDGVLVSKTEARSITTNYSPSDSPIDALHRVTKTTYSNGDPAITYAFDGANCLGLSACQNVGQRTSMTDAAGSEAWSYQVDSANSRSIHVNQRTTSGVTKTSTYYLDLAGNVTQAVYPTGRVVNYTVNTANRPITAADASNGITYATDFQTVPSGCLSGAVCYTPQGTFYALSIGQSSGFTGLNLTHTYNNRLQPNEFKASSTGGNAIDISYNFVDSISGHNAGHVYGITNNLDSTRSQTFGYDQLNRLTLAQTTSIYSTSPGHCWSETYSLDAWGNLNSIAATGNSNYTGCSQESGFSTTADGNNHIPLWAYDASGNATSDGVVTNYQWDGESQLKSAAGVNYTYDGDGRRVAKSNGTLYWYGSGGDILAETDGSGNTTAEYIFFGGKRVARVTAGTPGTGSATINGAEQSIAGSAAIAGTGNVSLSGSLQSKQVQTQTAASGTGSVTFSGTLQSRAPTFAAGSVTINGTEQTTSNPNCTTRVCTIYDIGGVQITVNGHLDNVSYGQGSLASAIASALASAINGDASSAVTATANGNVVSLTSKVSGSASNYSLSATSWTNDPTDFSGPSFTTSASGSSLTGGADTIYDSGSCTVTVNSHGDSSSWSGSGTTSSSIASALASSISSDGGASVSASASGSTVNLTAKTSGASTNYSLSSSCSYDTSHFSSASFTPSNSGSALTGGRDASYTTVYDSGTITITVNSHADSVSWNGSGTTSSSIASGLASAINADSGASVSASASGSTVNLTAKTTGASTNYSLSSSSTYDTSHFSSASFSSSNSGATLTGGANTGAPTYDSGSVWITVNGTQYAVSYGQGSSSSSLAIALAAAISAGTLANATANGSGITITAKSSGAGMNYSLSAGSSTSQPGSFPSGSFTAATSGSSLSGGKDGISYYVEDMLGSSRVVTTDTGMVCYDADFYPYGGERSYTNTCPQNYKFEGKERDTETGNDDFGVRYYSNRFGRWLSADWSAVPVAVPYANLTNPQTLNLYAMVADDPESFADLDGHADDDIVDHILNFVISAGTTWISDNAFGAFRPNPQTPEGQFGQAVGDFAAQQSGIGEAELGTAGLGASRAMAFVPGGQEEALGLAIVSAAAVLHGPVTAAIGTVNLAKDVTETSTSSKLHGNTAGDQPADLYELHDANGNFEKHGVSQDASKRYSQKQLSGGQAKVVERGPRKEMLKKERQKVETNPGPKNKEPWAGKKRVQLDPKNSTTVPDK